MNTENFTFQDLYEDEAVRFIADRHHATAQATVRHFLARNGLLEASSEMSLEDNEMEILRGLSTISINCLIRTTIRLI